MPTETTIVEAPVTPPIVAMESPAHKFKTAKADAVVTGVIALLAGGIARLTLHSSRPAVKSVAGTFVLLSVISGAMCVYKASQAIKYSNKK